MTKVSAGIIELPKVDLSGFHASGRHRAEFLADLRGILHDHGFFYLTGHGVSSSLTADVIRASKRCAPGDRQGVCGASPLR